MRFSYARWQPWYWYVSFITEVIGERLEVLTRRGYSDIYKKAYDWTCKFNPGKSISSTIMNIRMFSVSEYNRNHIQGDMTRETDNPFRSTLRGLSVEQSAMQIDVEAGTLEIPVRSPNPKLELSFA